MEKERPQAPGLRWNGDSRPLWRATKSAVAAGFLPKTVNLSKHLDDEVALIRACEKMQDEMTRWLAGASKSGIKPTAFDGTFGSLFTLYQSDPESRFQSLKAASRKPYNSYLRMLQYAIGSRSIDRCTGKDAKRWFDQWKEAEKPDAPPHLAKARTAIAVLKAALGYGIMCRLPGCAEFRASLAAAQFETMAPRTAVMTAEQVSAVRAAARAAGHASAALGYALQFEGAVRQWDVWGTWVPLSEKVPSSIIKNRKKWVGPTAANIDANMILRIKPSKTAKTTGAEIVIDLRCCPMVMEEIALGPGLPETGPLIVNANTGLPYSEDARLELWRKVSKDAELPPGTWNRDLRASGVTEGRDADVKTDDIKKVVGHSERSQTTAKVYDRGALEAHRRFAAARAERRQKPGA